MCLRITCAYGSDLEFVTIRLGGRFWFREYLVISLLCVELRGYVVFF